jgi:hypothetical protein
MEKMIKIGLLFKKGKLKLHHGKKRYERDREKAW